MLVVARAARIIGIMRLLFALLFFSTGFLTAEKPNIILVMTDDQGYGDSSMTGSPILKTPHIDSLAKDGAWLTRFYVNPVCTPTRSALMTGRYPQRTRAYDTYVGRAQMDPEEKTVAEYLRGGGYATGIFGKWHLGDCYPLRPHDQGFDEAVVHLGGGLGQPSDPIENGRRYTDPILFKNGKKKKYKGYCTDVYFDEAMKFMEAKKDQPFFVYLPTNAPHGPFHDVPTKSLAKYKDKAKSDTQARIFAMIDNVEENMGRLLEFLDEKKLSKNTLVIFMTDNGPNGRRHNGPFRASKGSVLEGGIRTMFFARWPEKIKAGHRNETTAAHIDLLPTFLEMAGVKVDTKIDGQSVLPLLTGNTPDDWQVDRPLTFQWHRGDPEKGKGFAHIEGPWKLVRPDGYGPNKPAELYHVTDDPGESENMAAKKPEVVKRLKANYEKWFDDVSTTRKRNYDFAEIVIGTKHETHTSFTKQDWKREVGNGWGTLGSWKIYSSVEKKYTPTIVLSKASKTPIPVMVLAGEFTCEGVIPAGRQKFELPPLMIPEGKMLIRATTTSGKPIKDFYQLHLSQVEE